MSNFWQFFWTAFAAWLCIAAVIGLATVLVKNRSLRRRSNNRIHDASLIMEDLQFTVRRIERRIERISRRSRRSRNYIGSVNELIEGLLADNVNMCMRLEKLENEIDHLDRMEEKRKQTENQKNNE